ncbi:MAG: hypothetical protein E7425_03690 [Ruminococcaceae bacterium]|nr:hypothetical protein [Oscillospiraceae bacterium]
MRRVLVCAAALALLLAACAPPEETRTPDDYELYYAVDSDGSESGNAIRVSTCRVEDSASLGTAALAERLLTELLGAPESPGLRSPFPEGTNLRHLTVAGGRAAVDLSAQYARLSGVDLSIADYCLTLTLTQLDGINAVRITVNGRELPYRKTQLLTAADALLAGVEDVPRPIDVSLYFLDVRTGELRAQQQSLALYEGQSRASAVLEALLRGPEGDDELEALLSPSFSVLSSRTEESTCYVNLSADAALPVDDTRRALALESLARSLLSLNGVEEVQFLIDGTAVPELTVPAPEPAAPTEA